MIEASNQIRAVIVEDSVNFREHLVFMLNELGKVTVTGTAASLLHAIQLVDQERPELVFLDMILEQGTGIQFLEHFRSTRGSMHVAVMTNALSPELKKFCLALGAEWFLDKAQGFDTIAGICEELSQKKLQGTVATTTALLG